MRSSQLLVINLCDEIFGIYQTDIQGLDAYREPTPIPGSPDYVEGIIAIRGEIIVIINLKEMFGMKNTNTPSNSMIVVVNSEEIKLGFAVDKASEALSLDISNYNQISDIRAKLNANYAECTKKYKGKPITILNLEYIVREIEI